MADMHFDIPFTVLNNRNKLGEKRRLEQREAFKKIIDFIKTNNVEYYLLTRSNGSICLPSKASTIVSTTKS